MYARPKYLRFIAHIKVSNVSKFNYRKARSCSFNVFCLRKHERSSKIVNWFRYITSMFHFSLLMDWQCSMQYNIYQTNYLPCQTIKSMPYNMKCHFCIREGVKQYIHPQINVLLSASNMSYMIRDTFTEKRINAAKSITRMSLDRPTLVFSDKFLL